MSAGSLVGGWAGVETADERALVVGSGPNGLAAAVTLARAGVAVHVVEGAATPGGGCRTEQLTLPGLEHDVCSTVHPLLAASPFFAEQPLAGVRLAHTDVAFAHPLDGGRAAAVSGSVVSTAAGLGRDVRAYRSLLAAPVRDAARLIPQLLAPILSAPRHPVPLARFGVPGLLSVQTLARGFRTEEARALLAGLAAHSMRPLSAPGTAAFAMLLGVLAHDVGWPVVEGGSARIVDALVAELEGHGGTIETGRWVEDLREHGPASATLLDVTPRQLLALAGTELPAGYRRRLGAYRYGPGVCKVDWALSGPVPWSAEPCLRAATLHVGGSFEEIARSEAQVNAGEHPERPFCIVVQPAVADPARVSEGHHPLYAYCHVPAGSPTDMSERIEEQVERFAPGFRELVLARSTMTAVDVERHDPNYVGGDINGGAATLRQTLMRPTASLRPYATPRRGLYLCSSATPPGGGVHGMCGVGAAEAALADLTGR